MSDLVLALGALLWLVYLTWAGVNLDRTYWR